MEYKFTTFLTKHILTEYCKLFRVRTTKEDALDNNAISLSEPLSAEPDSDTIGDMIPDRDSQEHYEAILEESYNEQLHNALEACLAMLKPEEADVLRKVYFDNVPAREIAEELNRSQALVSQRKLHGLRSLRKEEHLDPLLSFDDTFNFYRESQEMSIQEKYLFQKEWYNSEFRHEDFEIDRISWEYDMHKKQRLSANSF